MLFLKTCLVVCLPFFLLSSRHPSVYLTNLVSKACPHHNCIIVVFDPHQQYFGDVVSKYGFLPDMKSTFGNRSKEKWGNSRG